MEEDLERVRRLIERHRRQFGRRRMPERLRVGAWELFGARV